MQLDTSMPIQPVLLRDDCRYFSANAIARSLNTLKKTF
uniref:Uncharacterized protein n=1 Tax=Parascaris equorum TaxID=6256 RepID=A0A914R8S6_PAREQ